MMDSTSEEWRQRQIALRSQMPMTSPRLPITTLTFYDEVTGGNISLQITPPDEESHQRLQNTIALAMTKGWTLSVYPTGTKKDVSPESSFDIGMDVKLRTLVVDTDSTDLATCWG